MRVYICPGSTSFSLISMISMISMDFHNFYGFYEGGEGDQGGRERGHRPWQQLRRQGFDCINEQVVQTRHRLVGTGPAWLVPITSGNSPVYPRLSTPQDL